MFRIRRQAVVFGVLVAALLASDVALAGGMEYPDNATRALVRGGAFVARADDPSALYYNPAGLAKVRGTQLLFNYHFVRQNFRFQRAGTYGKEYAAYENPATGEKYRDVAGKPFPEVSTDPWIPVPFFTLSTDLGWRDDFTVAVGVFGPPAVGKLEYGLCVDPHSDQYPCPTDSLPSPGRYDMVSMEGVVIFTTLGAAYRINKYISVGAAFSWVYTQIKGRSVSLAVSEYELHPNDVFATLDIEDAFAPTGFLGLMVRPLRGLEAGLSVRLPVWIEATGTAENQISRELASQKAGLHPVSGPCVDDQGRPVYNCPAPVTVKSSLPLILRAGARWIFLDNRGRERADVELDFTYENWAMLDAQTIKIDGILANEGTPVPEVQQIFNLNDTFSVRLGGSYTFFDLIPGQLTASLGVFYDSAATPQEWTRLGFDGFERFGVAGGLSCRIRGFELTLGGSYIGTPTRTVDNSKVRAVLTKEPDVTKLPVVGNGVYKNEIVVLMAGLRVDFVEVLGGQHKPRPW